MLYPASTASLKNIFTVSNEYSSKFLPINGNFFNMSGVTVIIWHPTWFAWNRFKTSLGLAQISSVLELDDNKSEYKRLLHNTVEYIFTYYIFQDDNIDEYYRKNK